MDALLYGRRESAQLLSLSLRTLDQLISERKLTVRRVGKRVLVVADSLREYASATDADVPESRRKDTRSSATKRSSQYSVGDPR